MATPMRFGSMMTAAAFSGVAFCGRGCELKLLLLKELECLAAGNVAGGDPAANIGPGEVAEGATADLGEDGVGAMLACEELDQAAAIGSFVFVEDEGVVLSIGFHRPLGFSEVS